MNIRMKNLENIKTAVSNPSSIEDKPVAEVKNNPVQTSNADATPKAGGAATEMISPVKLEHTYKLIAWKSMFTTFNPGVTSNAILTKETMINDAREAGLNDREVNELSARLDRMSPEEQSSELAFLNKNVTSSPNADRALRTYIKLERMKDEHPERITNDIVHT